MSMSNALSILERREEQKPPVHLARPTGSVALAPMIAVFALERFLVYIQKYVYLRGRENKRLQYKSQYLLQTMWKLEK